MTYYCTKCQSEAEVSRHGESGTPVYPRPLKSKCCSNEVELKERAK